MYILLLMVYMFYSVAEVSLFEYLTARRAHCAVRYTNPCSKCLGMLKVGNIVLEQGLPDAFQLASPTVKYTAERARRKLLQLPLACIRVGDPSKGQSFSILMEKFSGTDYGELGGIVNGLLAVHSQKGIQLQKSVVKMLLSIAKSDRERKCLRFAITAGV